MMAAVHNEAVQLQQQHQLPLNQEKQCLNFLSKNMWGSLCELLTEDESNRENTVRFMDNLLDGEFEANVLRRHPDLHLKDTRSVIKKWLWKIVKMYKFPKGICPNLLSSHRMGFISHAYHQYQLKQTNHCNWRDLALHAAGNCERTQKRVVNMLVGLGMIQDAAWFANDFQIDDNELSDEVQQERQNYINQCIEVSKDEMLWSSDDERSGGEPGNPNNPFHSFPYPRPVIQILNNKEKFQHCVDCLSQAGSVVGIDTEWQTLFNSETDRDCIALIQLAVFQNVYIVDVTTLIHILSKDDWAEFFYKVFSNKTVIKLGYSLTQDYKIIKHTFPYIDPQEFVNIIDLQTTMDKKATSSNSKDSKDKEKIRKRRQKGLSGLTEEYLHRPLDKTYQVSCWAKRPLRKAQVIYAALDAYVLLQIYEVALQKGINLSTTDSKSKCPGSDNSDQIVNGCIDGKETVDEKTSDCDMDKSDTNSCCDSGLSSNQCDSPAISPHSLRVIVDTMLQGLGWSLRSVGVDTIILKMGQSHKDAISLALQGGRVVLTSGKVYQMFSARLGKDKCYCVSNNKAKKQLQEVLTHFNVRVQKQDILSRCQLCNSRSFVLVESDKIRTLKEVRAHLQKSLSSTTGKSWISNPNGPVAAAECIVDPDVLPCELRTAPIENLDCSPRVENVQLIDMSSATFRNSGVALQLDYIPDCLLDQDTLFYCCVSCGKAYWDGCHYDRVINQLNRLIPLYSDGQKEPSIYDILQADVNSNEQPVSY